MSKVLGVTLQALRRWMARRTGSGAGPDGRGRPESIPELVQEHLRARYREKYRQWGPRVLRSWAKRVGMGEYSHGAIARVIADLVEKPPAKLAPVRYEVTASGVMWSEDGTGFWDRGRKKELLVLQDECSRFKVNHRMADGPANAEDVCAYMREAFDREGPPLVVKHDGGSIFHEKKVKSLLDEYGVVDLTGPTHYPQYNGKTERSNRDIKSYVRAMVRFGPWRSLSQRISSAMKDLNEERPRPVLNGRTAREVYERDRMKLPDRAEFRKEVDAAEERLKQEAVSRRDRDCARRRAVEEVLLDYGLVVRVADVSTDCPARMGT